jgi:pectate lyase
MAGAGGMGGLPTVPDNGCNVRLTDTPTGYASQGGGTVGGGKATPILVTTKEQLEMYLADNQPRVLYLMNDVDYRTAARNVQVCADDTTCDNGSGTQVDNARVSATCDPGEHMATRTRNESRLNIASNKTLIGIGVGRGAAIRGASLNIGSSQQVILRNLRIYDVNPNLVEAGDGITLNESSHIWLDHLLIEQISDGFIDIGSADSTLDDYITLSFNHINGRTAYLCGGHHNFVNFVDNGHVTYHHNWFDNGGGRNPKIGHERSNVHLYNNYWLNITYFCITAQEDGEARVESNYFENALRPHWRQLDGNGTAGIAIDSGNVYIGTSNGNTNRDTGGTVFTVPYTYTKETAEAARTSVMSCSGPQPIR